VLGVCANPNELKAGCLIGARYSTELRIKLEVNMSDINLLVLRFVHTVASVFLAGSRLLFAGDVSFANTNEGLFSCIMYKKL
jgi:hypothetical protein